MDDKILLIPYGLERWSDDYLVPAGPGGPATCRVPHVVVEPPRREPLRLHDGPYDFAEAPPLQDLAEPAAQLDFLRAYHDRQCSLWGKFQKRFVAQYFAFVAAEVERNRQELEDRVADFHGLYNYRDWLFSALRPLPRAHLELPDGSMTRVDFAFWTGETLLAIDLTGNQTSGAAMEERAERLRDRGIVRIEIANAALAAGDLTGLLPSALLRFWEHAPIPCGPFIPGTLAATTFGAA